MSEPTCEELDALKDAAVRAYFEAGRIVANPQAYQHMKQQMALLYSLHEKLAGRAGQP